MSDRATYLARTLLTRMQNLEGILAGEPGGRDGASATTKRREQVAKVLAIEAGVTDEASVRLVESALPHVSARDRLTDRALSELAAFLRERLGGAL
jgi:hypothetical protein